MMITIIIDNNDNNNNSNDTNANDYNLNNNKIIIFDKNWNEHNNTSVNKKDCNNTINKTNDINININNNINNDNDNSNSIEVAFFHAWPEQSYAELIHSFRLNGALDLTAGSGHAAIASIKAKKTYVGLCLSDAHKDLLEEWLQWRIFNEMQDSNSSLHDASLSLLTRSGDERQKKRKLEEAQAKTKPKKPKTPEADEGSSDAGEDD